GILGVTAALTAAAILIGFISPLRAVSEIPGGKTATQAQPGQPLAFEVASVKLNKSGDRYFGVDLLPGGRLSAKNMPLGFLPLEAYKTSFQRVVPGANLDRQILNLRYDIEAVAAKGAIPPGSPAKVRNEKLLPKLPSLLA